MHSRNESTEKVEIRRGDEGKKGGGGMNKLRIGKMMRYEVMEKQEEVVFWVFGIYRRKREREREGGSDSSQKYSLYMYNEV